MSREKMVTRTVGTTDITAIVLNVETMVSEDVTFTVSGQYSLGTKELKNLLASKSDDTHLYVKATLCAYEEKLYGMTEAEFLKYAKVLPPRTAKADEE